MKIDTREDEQQICRNHKQEEKQSGKDNPDDRKSGCGGA
jgi:hypothetical protein